MRLCLTLAFLIATACASLEQRAPPRTTDEVLAQAPESDWRTFDPDELLIADTPQGRIVIAIAREMAPNTVGNVLALAHNGFYDGLAFIRAQDDYVAQWGDATNQKPIVGAATRITAEFDRDARGVMLDALPDSDTYADEVGFVRGFPAAMAEGRIWLTHCYGMVGVGRDEDADSGNGSELYFVIGHPPRHLDRNVTLIGRVIEGMAIIATLPRGSEKMGFYAAGVQGLPLTRVRSATDLPPAECPRYRTLLTSSPSFKALVEARRNRRDAWTKHKAGAIDVCNVPNATQALP